MNEMKRLPVGWTDATLKEIAQIFMGQSPASSLINSDKKGLPFFQGKTEFTDIYPLVNKYCEEPSRIAEKDDILLSVRAPVGPVNIAKVRSGFGRGLSAIRSYTGVDYKFLFYQLRSIERHIESLGTGSTFSGINKDKVESLLINIAPQKEQKRIVYKLEELFSEFDEGVKELKAAQTKLIQYRQSLLKSAVEGSLTQQWRAENSDRVQETGEKLLARILKQRREQWQQQKLAEFAEKGKTPPKNWQNKYPEPVQPDTTDLPELPEGWVWASLDMLGDIVSGVTKGTKRKAEIAVREVPYLRVANVQRGFLNLDEIKTIPATESDIKKYALVPGDILFNEGGDRDKLGRGWVWYGEVENCIHQNHVFRMRAFVTDLVPEFISHHGNTFGKLWFQSAGKQTTNLASINKGILQEFPVPLAPVIEQNKIIELLEEELTLLAKQEEYTLAALTASEAQRKNILKSAFSGQLVPQDPNDEPASVLLEKIKQEREALAQMPKPRKPSKPKKKVDLMNTLLEVLTVENNWIDAQYAFQKCGIVDGTSTDRIEEIYTELRRLEKAGKIQIQRQGDFDQLKLIKQDVKED